MLARPPYLNLLKLAFLIQLGALLLSPAMAPLSAAPQDIPPQVLLFSRIRDHMRDELAGLPNYTCTETIRRFRKPSGPNASLKPLDTVRLEVLFAEGEELYASPGARQFLESDPARFIGSGMIGTGVFASWLRTLFVNNQAVFTWRGEDTVSGQKRARWDFRVAAAQSGYTITVSGVSGKAAIKGSFWADPDSLDLLELSVDADDIAYGVPAMEVGSTVV